MSEATGLNFVMASYCLIGETDSFIAMLLARFAQAHGLQPVQAQAGEEVYALARQLRPVVIVLDGELPGALRGWEAVREIRADPDLARIPVISCSWLNEPDARALMAQAIAYLQKPELHYDEFVAALRLVEDLSLDAGPQCDLADATGRPSPLT
ncbi:MAG: response regulator [Anaerolineae bacterium]|nr:response regulator [Thermoflexales bacterium]MDW8407660.1 response regulator [Anaerolineae bacterium]